MLDLAMSVEALESHIALLVAAEARCARAAAEIADARIGIAVELGWLRACLEAARRSDGCVSPRAPDRRPP